MNRVVYFVPVAAIAVLLGIWATQRRQATAPESVVSPSHRSGPRFVRTEVVGPAWVMALPRMLGRDDCVRFGRSGLTVAPDARWTIVANLWFANEDECRSYVAVGDMPPGLKSRDENLALGDARWPREQDTLGNLPAGGDVREEAAQAEIKKTAERRVACAYYEIGEVIRNARCQVEGSAG